MHESGDDSVLEQLTFLSEMMSGYGELIEKHVEAVKKIYRGKKKKRRKTGATRDAATDTAADVSVGGSLRERMMAFGSKEGGQNQPFAWLRGLSAPSAYCPDTTKRRNRINLLSTYHLLQATF